jgi:transcriptional antiterminator NusG
MAHAPSLDRWYALAVVSGRERKVRERILDRLRIGRLDSSDLELICPEEEIVVVRGASDQKPSRRMTLPGYILLSCRRLTPDRVAAIRGTTDVLGFLGGDDSPSAMRESEVDALLGSQQTGAKRLSRRAWTVGQGVTIIAGPLTDFTGTIDELDEGRQTATISVEIFGRQTPAQVAFDQLRAA